MMGADLQKPTVPAKPDWLCNKTIDIICKEYQSGKYKDLKTKSNTEYTENGGIILPMFQDDETVLERNSKDTMPLVKIEYDSGLSSAGIAALVHLELQVSISTRPETAQKWCR